MAHEEKTTSSKLIYKGRVISYYVDQVDIDGATAEREHVTHPGGAAILAVLDGKIIFEKQFRYPYHAFVYELPAGKIDPNEDPANTARRELEEETGYYAEIITPMGELYPSVGYTNEIIHLYIAENLKRTKTHFDEDEYVDLCFFTVEEALKMIDDGTIKDAKTMALIYKYYLKIQGGK